MNIVSLGFRFVLEIKCFAQPLKIVQRTNICLGLFRIKIHEGFARMTCPELSSQRWGLGVQPFFVMSNIGQEEESVIKYPSSKNIKEKVAFLLQTAVKPNCFKKRTKWEKAVESKTFTKNYPEKLWPTPRKEDDLDTGQIQYSNDIKDTVLTEDPGDMEVPENNGMTGDTEDPEKNIKPGYIKDPAGMLMPRDPLKTEDNPDPGQGRGPEDTPTNALITPQNQAIISKIQGRSNLSRKRSLDITLVGETDTRNYYKANKICEFTKLCHFFQQGKCMDQEKSFCLRGPQKTEMMHHLCNFLMGDGRLCYGKHPRKNHNKARKRRK